MKWSVFVSGSGTNLQHFLDLERDKKTHQKVGAVVADRPCRALERAERAGKPGLCLSPKNDDFLEKTFAFLRAHEIEAIFLLGYMRILSTEFIENWPGLLVNLHPSLLPRHKGLRAIERSLEARDPVLGVSIHHVTPDLDSGEILLQRSFEADYARSPEALFDAVRALEKTAVEAYLKSLD